MREPKKRRGKTEGTERIERRQPIEKNVRTEEIERNWRT